MKNFLRKGSVMRGILSKHLAFLCTYDSYIKTTFAVCFVKTFLYSSVFRTTIYICCHLFGSQISWLQKLMINGSCSNQYYFVFWFMRLVWFGFELGGCIWVRLWLRALKQYSQMGIDRYQMVEIKWSRISCRKISVFAGNLRQEESVCLLVCPSTNQKEDLLGAVLLSWYMYSLCLDYFPYMLQSKNISCFCYII